MCIKPTHIIFIFKLSEPLHKTIKKQKTKTFINVLAPSRKEEGKSLNNRSRNCSILEISGSRIRFI